MQSVYNHKQSILWSKLYCLSISPIFPSMMAMLMCIAVTGLSISISKDDVKENEGTSCLFILTDPRDPHAVLPFSYSWTLLLTAVPICVSYSLISSQMFSSPANKLLSASHWGKWCHHQAFLHVYGHSVTATFNCFSLIWGWFSFFISCIRKWWSIEFYLTSQAFGQLSKWPEWAGPMKLWSSAIAVLRCQRNRK